VVVFAVPVVVVFVVVVQVHSPFSRNLLGRWSQAVALSEEKEQI
jgi:hypothetical protein